MALLGHMIFYGPVGHPKMVYLPRHRFGSLVPITNIVSRYVLIHNLLFFNFMPSLFYRWINVSVMGTLLMN